MYLGKIIIYADNTFRYAIKTIYYNNRKDHNDAIFSYDVKKISFSSILVIDENN